MMHSSQSGFSRNSVLASMITAIILISSLSYFFVWRPADSDYQTAAAQVSSMVDSGNALASRIEVVRDPANITDATVADVQKAISAYQQTMTTLDKNKVVGRDLTVKSTYNQTKSSLVKYGESASDLVRSLKLYTAVLDNCSNFTQSLDKNDLSLKNSLLNSCLAAIKDGQSSSHHSFNSQYFDEYRDNTWTYVEAIVKNTNTPSKTASSVAQSEIDEVYNSIHSLGKEKIDYMLFAPTEEINKLLSVINSQQRAFLR